LQLLLPLGLSFYSFQAIAYTTEIYRKKLEPRTSFTEFALYLAFFPKLIAGPLIRPAAFFQQISQPAARPSAPRLREALGLLGLGLFKKIVIADSLASLAEVAFSAAATPAGTTFPTPLYWQGFYLYAFHIYADFSGYTDLARASARLLGLDLPDNFQQPYLAPTLGAFWNRWHMSLTQWFREYLFFPLSRTLLNLTQRRFARAIQIAVNLITMTLIGLWHGAAWTFVAWGLWHGLLLSIERWLDIKPTRTWQKLLGALITFHCVGLGWVLFRADSFASAGRFLIGLVNGQQLLWFAHYGPLILVCADWRPIFLTAGLMMVLVLWILAAVRGVDAQPFIYGRF
jgi:D-alanyl-lipoteichoic acid acyltransferase DltB (MBOAT superfamily)